MKSIYSTVRSSLTVKMKFFYFSFIFILLPSYGFGSMVLSQSIIYFDKNHKSTNDLIISNPDDETLYLKTEVMEVVNPGKPDEKRVKIDNPDKIMLMVTPQKAVIAPHMKKTIRLVNLESPGRAEKVYRINFEPVVGDMKATQTAIKILVAYQVLAFVRPDDILFDVEAERDKEYVKFTNEGNANVLMRNGKICDIDTNVCEKIKGSHRLYAGETWGLNIPAVKNSYVSYEFFDGKDAKEKVFFKPS